MAQIQNLFNGKKIRTCKDKNSYWVSVVDIIAALRGIDYDTARNYWKQLKYRMMQTKKIFVYHQLKLQAKDGKQRYTDVMRYKDIVRLIGQLPLGAAKACKKFKKLICCIAANSTTMRKIFDVISAETERSTKRYTVEEKILKKVTWRDVAV